jgi:hypothetical protein
MRSTSISANQLFGKVICEDFEQMQVQDIHEPSSPVEAIRFADRFWGGEDSNAGDGYDPLITKLGVSIQATEKLSSMFLSRHENSI